MRIYDVVVQYEVSELFILGMLSSKEGDLQKCHLAGTGVWSKCEARQTHVVPGPGCVYSCGQDCIRASTDASVHECRFMKLQCAKTRQLVFR